MRDPKSAAGIKLYADSQIPTWSSSSSSSSSSSTSFSSPSTRSWSSSSSWSSYRLKHGLGSRALQMGQAQGLLIPAPISFVSFISLQTRYDLWGRFQSRRVLACYDDGTLALAALRLPERLHNPCHRRRAALRLLLWQIPSPAGMRMPKPRVRLLQRPHELMERSPRC